MLRPRLHDALRHGPFAWPGATAGCRPSVTVVCAPAGFGKSTLLAEWASRQPVRRRHDDFAWLTLDHTDNVPCTLWSEILTSLGSESLWPQAPAWLVPGPPAPHSASQFVIAVEEAVRRRGRTCLVLDDVHHLQDPDVLHSLDLLIRYQPAGLDLVLCSRTTPPLSLRRLWVEGRMWEFTAADLAFSPAQAAAVFSGRGLHLSKPDLRRLMARTEGWPAAVSLVAEALATSPEGTEIDSLMHSDSRLADYLVGEIVAKLSPVEREVLVGISVCEHVTTDLVTTLTGRADAGAILEEMEQRTLLVNRWGPGLDGYRCHGLLQSHLYEDLGKWNTAQLAALHRRAADWFAGHGEPLAALHHASRGDDPERLARLVGSQGLALVLAGRGTALRTLAATLPTTVMRRPSAGLVVALADLVAGDQTSVNHRLDRLSTEPDPEHQPRADHLRTCVDQYRARLSGTVAAQPDNASALLEHPDLGVLALVNRAAADFAVGRYAAAGDALTKALGLATERNWHYAALHCLAHLAGVAAVDSDFACMLAAAERALNYAADHGLADTAACCLAHAVAGWAGYQTLDNGTAQTHAKRAADLLCASNDRNVTLAVHTLVAAIQLDGTTDHEDALRGLRRLWAEVAPGNPIEPVLIAGAAPIVHHGALRLCRLDWALAAEQHAVGLLGMTGDTHLLHARRLANTRNLGKARCVAETITAEGTSFHLATNRVQAYLLAAVLAYHAHDTVAAHWRLDAALDLAEPLYAVRPFATGGQRVRELLAVRAGQLGHHNTFVDDILAKTRPVSSAAPEMLTRRERQLLAALPSPATTQEMADGLNLSVNTVKTHLRSTYRKLGARNRREAVATARKNGLL